MRVPSRRASRRPIDVRLLLALGLSVGAALDNGVGDVPAMGWNSWNQFRCDINEDLIREVARAIVSSGLRDAGYRYINVDDYWQEYRGLDGHIVPSHKRFPSGMRALGDYIHSLGLKFGLLRHRQADVRELSRLDGLREAGRGQLWSFTAHPALTIMRALL